MTRQSVYNWVEDYLRDHDPAALADAPRMGCPGFWTGESRRLLWYLLDHSPEEFGYPDANWTLRLFREQLDDGLGHEPSEDTVRRELHRLGYVWKRPRYVLEPDPEREKKTSDPPADPGPAGPLRRPGRGRDGVAAVPAPAGRLVA
jgi:transposase